jgi:hypothetical protein
MLFVKIEQKTKMSAFGTYKIPSHENGDQPPKSANPVGRPPKLTTRNKRSYINEAIKGRRLALDEITNYGSINVSSRTVRKALHQADIKNRVAKKKAFLMPRHTANPITVIYRFKSSTLSTRRKKSTATMLTRHAHLNRAGPAKIVELN